MNKIKQGAKLFSQKLLREIGPVKLLRVVRLNKEPLYINSSLCASHNYCNTYRLLKEVCEELELDNVYSDSAMIHWEAMESSFYVGAEHVARAFADIVKRDIRVEELQTVVGRNKVNEPYICASHDFLDANVSMLEAFERTFSLKEEEAFELTNTNEGHALWDAAWRIAKRNDFWINS